ncbi:MFS transporter [Streptomyces sp. NPDC058619]|uniref:MFS transporter n=1 Tax=unclassified Streptomyces TaxID=2593676 RepID=UPI00365F18EF
MSTATKEAQRSLADPAQYRPGRTITDWTPEDPSFWRSTGKKVATRNLWIAVPALLVAFVVWQVWSITATNLKDVGFGFSQSQLFWLTAVPGITGGTARILYTFIGPMIGQRRFTAASTVVLIVPLLWLGFAVQNPDTPYGTMIAIAALCGIGGANFSSSLANIGFFYPKREKGNATGINGGLGNLGVSVVQLPAAIAAYGFFFIPAMFANFAVTSAMWGFVAFYASCVVVAWWFYARKGAEAPSWTLRERRLDAAGARPGSGFPSSPPLPGNSCEYFHKCTRDL